MIVKGNIKKNIETLERLYNSSSKSQRKEYFYSKLAILELCGWIEQSMDGLVKSSSKRTLKEEKNIITMNEAIKNIYGFDYKQHFKKMLIQLIGLYGVEKMEKKVDPLKFARFIGALGMLKKPRDTHAHTHTATLTTIDSPSVTMSKFQFLYDGLTEIETVLKKMKY